MRSTRLKRAYAAPRLIRFLIDQPSTAQPLPPKCSHKTKRTRPSAPSAHALTVYSTLLSHSTLPSDELELLWILAGAPEFLQPPMYLSPPPKPKARLVPSTRGEVPEIVLWCPDSPPRDELRRGEYRTGAGPAFRGGRRYAYGRGEVWRCKGKAGPNEKWKRDREKERKREGRKKSVRRSEGRFEGTEAEAEREVEREDDEGVRDEGVAGQTCGMGKAVWVSFDLACKRMADRIADLCLDAYGSPPELRLRVRRGACERDGGFGLDFVRLGL